MFLTFRAATTSEIYTLSLHDALPILRAGGSECPDSSSHPDLAARQSLARLGRRREQGRRGDFQAVGAAGDASYRDRKSTRLNSSHRCTSYAVFCLKKKKIGSCYCFAI